MRNTKIVPGEYYHLLNRGVSKQNIFFDKSDWTRFLFLILYLQSPAVFQNIGRPVKEFVKHSVFNIEQDVVLEAISRRYVELIAFCIMPNHFHLIVKEEKESGIAQYMQRCLNGYTKYINTRYQKSGHIFQGPYKAVHVGDNRQLLYLSAYIYKNPRELVGWKNRENLYPWSSYQDYIKTNRWGGLLSTDIILSQFKNSDEYQEFIQSSSAKMLAEELEDEFP